MPNKPKRPCSFPGCPCLTKDGRCEKHKIKAWQGNNEALRTVKGRTLQKARDRLFDEQPLCVECLEMGRDMPATIRDHIIPLAEGGQDVAENTQGLCEDCHKRKVEEEKKRGRWGK